MDRRIKLCLIKILRKGELYTMDLFSKIITGIVAVSTAVVTVAMVVSKNQQSSQYISDYTYSPNQNYRQQQQCYNNNTTPMMNGTFNDPMDGDMNVSRRNNHGVYGNNMNSYQNPYQYNSYASTYPQYNNYNGYVNQQPMSYNNNNNQQYAYGYGYGYSDNNIQQNPYQSNPYQSNPYHSQYQSNPYQSNPYQSNPYQSNPYQNNQYQNNQNNKYGQCPDENNYTQYNCYAQRSASGCVSPDNYGVYNEPPRQPMPDNNSNFGSYNVDEINPSKFNQPTNVANNNYQPKPQNTQSMGITSFVQNGDVGNNDDLIRDLMGKMEVVT